jgi:hypothetical protein
MGSSGYSGRRSAITLFARYGVTPTGVPVANFQPLNLEKKGRGHRGGDRARIGMRLSVCNG